MKAMRARIRTPEGKRAYNKDLFTRVARAYDRDTRLMSLGQDQAWKRRLVDGLPVLPHPRCVDLACGTGDLTLELARRYPDGDVLGIDLTPSMIEVARARAGKSAVRFAIGDMTRLDLPDASVDLITGGYALRNAPVLDDALAEIRRVLVPGGQAAFLDFVHPASPRRAAVQLTLLKYWCGFVSLLVHGRVEHAYIAESLRQFPDRAKVRDWFTRHDLEVTAEEPMFGGFVSILRLRRAG
jgi:ubiquinone/menaquinone biosynthesis methyltransferase